MRRIPSRKRLVLIVALSASFLLICCGVANFSSQWIVHNQPCMYPLSLAHDVAPPEAFRRATQSRIRAVLDGKPDSQADSYRSLLTKGYTITECSEDPSMPHYGTCYVLLADGRYLLFYFEGSWPECPDFDVTDDELANLELIDVGLWVRNDDGYLVEYEK